MGCVHTLCSHCSCACGGQQEECCLLPAASHTSTTSGNLLTWPKQPFSGVCGKHWPVVYEFPLSGRKNLFCMINSDQTCTGKEKKASDDVKEGARIKSNQQRSTVVWFNTPGFWPTPNSRLILAQYLVLQRPCQLTVNVWGGDENAGHTREANCEKLANAKFLSRVRKISGTYRCKAANNSSCQLDKRHFIKQLFVQRR